MPSPDLPASSGPTELRRPELLDRKRHDRSGFDSGDPGLDEWLRRYAGQNRQRDTAATWVIADTSSRVVAYASLSMTAVDRSTAPQALARQAPEMVPALLLGRLAVDRLVTRRGVGRSLVAHVLATAIGLNEAAACRAVVVTALNTEARRWWERLGFMSFDPDDPVDRDLYLLTASIEATLRHLAVP